MHVNPRAKSGLLGIDDMLGNNPMSETFDTFFSLSRHRDDANRWEYGAKGTGFAVVIAGAISA